MMLDRRLSTVRCLACGTVLVSRHVHDYRVCGCPQETMVDGGRSYLRWGGVDVRLVEILVDPTWPSLVTLELLQEAARLAMELGCRFEPPKDATDGAVAAVALRLRGCVATANEVPEAAREALIGSGEWPPLPPNELPLAMVRPIPGRRPR